MAQHHKLPEALHQLTDSLKGLHEARDALTTPLAAGDAFYNLAGHTWPLAGLAEKLQLRAQRFSNGALNKDTTPSRDQVEAAMQICSATSRLTVEAKRLQRVLNEVARGYYELEAVSRNTKTEI
ncbi:hypothetical protein LZ318_31865 [Saccharopolyspora indica]|uniref:hypothetical protein n=1 Tax=Saccharopolyspora indica TaxID=1229659 RepID=UPI0022EA7119|nr:hypothetical protein [Saccharopolyspora indica]MDA3644165.1 hypothetical protein [Saccharopolyspora indica]